MVRSAALLACAGLAACTSSPEPLGEALVVVQTDASIPRRVGRLRIDVYGADGALLESRELSAPSPRDWPISFSVVADRDAERFVTVRLRAYPRGTSWRARSSKVGAPTPAPCPWSTARSRMLAGPRRRSGWASRSPSAEARVRSRRCSRTRRQGAGPRARSPRPRAPSRRSSRSPTRIYKIEVVSALPDGARGEPGGDTTLAIRSDCALPTTQLACNDDVVPGSRLSALTLDLAPGTYWIVTGGADPAPADLTLLASRANAAVQVTPAAASGHRPRRSRAVARRGDQIDSSGCASSRARGGPCPSRCSASASGRRPTSPAARRAWTRLACGCLSTPSSRVGSSRAQARRRRLRGAATIRWRAPSRLERRVRRSTTRSASRVARSCSATGSRSRTWTTARSPSVCASSRRSSSTSTRSPSAGSATRFVAASCLPPGASSRTTVRSRGGPRPTCAPGTREHAGRPRRRRRSRIVPAQLRDVGRGACTLQVLR